jgi:recombination protein RecA
MAVVDRKAKLTRHLSVEELMAEVRKEHGEGSIVRGVDREVLPRLTTGAIGFDLMLGGGLPAGQPNEVIGEFSSGKTSFVLKLIAANQALDPKFLVLWIASEAFVEPWAVTAGCDLDRIIRFKSQNMEAVYDHLVRFTTNRAVDLIVVDSLPALTPMAEYEGDMADVLPALAARTNNKFFRKLGMSTASPLLGGERLCTTIMVNQWREKVGVFQGDPRVTPGGRGKDFHYFSRIELRRAEWIQETKSTPRIGIKIAARTIKNKTYPPQRTALVDFYFAPRGAISAGSYDVALDLMLAAIELDIIDLRGNRYYFNDQRWTGKDPVLQSLREDLDLRRLVYAETIRAAGLIPDPALIAAPKKRLTMKKR